MRKPFFIILCCVLSACSTFPKDDIAIESDYDPKANFSAYKTYAWFAAVGMVNDSAGRWQPPQFDAEAEIETQIAGELQKRGKTEAANNADMLVVYGIGMDMDVLKIKRDPETEMPSLENIPQAALVVVLVDPDTQYPIWASVATAEYKNAEPEVAKHRLTYAIGEMFKTLPK